MSTCGSSLRHIFESIITENSSASTSAESSASSMSLIDTLSSSWKQIRPSNPSSDHSFTEIFGELHFKESPEPTHSSPTPWQQQPPSKNVSALGNYGTEDDHNGNGYHRKSENLQLCTEGLGSESLDYVEDLKCDSPPGTWLDHNKNNIENDDGRNNSSSRKMGDRMYRKRRSTNGMMTFPPPISSIGKTGKPGVWFQSYSQDGCFILEEVKIPTYERFHASREDGRLRLCFIQPSDEEDEDDDDDDDDVASEAEDEGEANGGEYQTKGDIKVRDVTERGHLDGKTFNCQEIWSLKKKHFWHFPRHVHNIFGRKHEAA